MKKLFLMIGVALIGTAAWAQDSQIYKVQQLLDEANQKSGEVKDARLKEAREIISTVVTNPKTKKLAYAYNVAGQVELRLLNDEVDKMKVHQPIDTMLFINSMDNAVKYFSKSYELDHQPDAKGKVKPKFDYGDKYTIGERNGNVYWAKQIVPYYLMCAQLYFSNGNKEKAYEYYMKHLEYPKSVFFTKAQTDSIYKADSNYPKVGYYATMLAFEDKDYDKVLQTVDYAINSDDKTTKQDGYYMKAYSLQHKGDSAQWLNTMLEAMENTDNVDYPQIVLKYYYDHHQQAEATRVADEFIQKAPQNKMAHYIKGVVLMDQTKDLEALAEFNKALEIDSQFVEAKANIGVLKFNELRDLNQKAITNNKDPKYKAQQLELKGKLEEAKKIFEDVANLAPDKTDLWQGKLEQINNLINVIDSNLAEVAKRDKK